jgi:hypothetical protein
VAGRSAVCNRARQRPEDKDFVGQRRARADVPRCAGGIAHHLGQGIARQEGRDLPRHQQSSRGGQGAGGQRARRARPASAQHGQRHHKCGLGESKDVDAAFGNFPLISLNEIGRAKIIYTTKGDNPTFERQAAVLVTEAFETAHPRIVAKIVKGLVAAAQWSSDEANRDALMEIWAESGTPASVFRYDFADQPLRYRNSPIIDPFLIEQYRVQAKQAKEFGLVRRDIEVNGWFEPRYLEQALRELGIENYWTRYGTDGKPLGS